jgi:ribosome-associated protein
MKKKSAANDAIQHRVFLAVEAALNKKAADLSVLEVAGLTTIADYFILCSGNTERQTQAIADAVEENVRKNGGARPTLVEGAHPGRWILIDYGDFIVHIFTEECRRFYGLERLWGDAPDVTARFAPAANGATRRRGDAERR